MTNNQMTEIDELSRKTIQGLKPYSSTPRNESSDVIYLNANENPYPREYALLSKEFNRYPEPQPSRLIENYAQFLGVTPDNILVSLGGDESIKLIIEAFCEPRDEAILYCPPTFGMYDISARVVGVNSIEVPLDNDFNLDVAGIKSALDNTETSVKVIFLCSPNNPTGNSMDRAAMIEILEAAKGRAIVVIDEAYIEFSDQKTDSVTDLINTYPHLAIIRTLSKAFGLAGIRCGFTVGSKALIDVLKKVIAPYPIPIPVIDIATQTVNEAGIAEMWRVVDKIKALKAELKTDLEALPIVKKVYKSDTNWLLVEVSDASAIFNYLLQNNIHVRDQRGVLQNMLRISIGTREENRRLIDVLKTYP